MRPAPRLAAALAAALFALLTGAGAPTGPASADPAAVAFLPVSSSADKREAYLRGYQRGDRDRDKGRRYDPDRWGNEFERRTARAFEAGYGDGYYRRPNAYQWPEYTGSAPSWLVGSFAGYNPMTRKNVYIRCYPNRSCAVKAGKTSYRGYYRRGKLQLSNGSYRIDRTRRGFLLIYEPDPRNRTDMRRID